MPRGRGHYLFIRRFSRPPKAGNRKRRSCHESIAHQRKPPRQRLHLYGADGAVPHAGGRGTELVQAGARTTHGCTACGQCRVTGKCVFDDVVNETAPKLLRADALVIGAPVYYASPAGGAIAFMDRLFYSVGIQSLTMKVGASVVSCRRGGNTASFDVLNKYFTIAGMPIASSQYWNMVYGNTPEEVLRDKEGLQTMRTLGRNMAFLMKSIQLGKAQYGLPQRETPIVTSFHHE